MNTDQIVTKIEAGVQAMQAKQTELETGLADAAKLASEGKEVGVQALAKMEATAKEVAQLSTDIAELQQTMHASVVRGKEHVDNLGEMVIKSQAFTAFADGASAKAKIDVQANTLLGQEGSPLENSNTLVGADRLQQIMGGGFRTPRIAGDLIPIYRTNGNAVEYTKETTFTNAAAETAEGVAAPETNIDFTLATANIRTIPTHIKASRQVLEDSDLLASYLNIRLANGVVTRMDNQLVRGNGSGQNIVGISQTSQSTAYTAAAGETKIDTVNRQQALVAAQEFEATASLINPLDWHEITRARSSKDGHYIIADGVNMLQPVLWGKPVIVSNAIPQGYVATAAWDKAFGVALRRDATVEIFNQNEDDAEKLLVTIMAHMRGALMGFRPPSAQYGAFGAGTF